MHESFSWCYQIHAFSGNFPGNLTPLQNNVTPLRNVFPQAQHIIVLHISNTLDATL